MKTIIYSIIAIFIFGIIAKGFTNKANTTTNILIQSVDSNITSASLFQSAAIITNRLKDFNSGKFELTVIREKDQIQVSFIDNQDTRSIDSLLIGKGALAFYETYTSKSLSELLKGDNHIFSLFNDANANDSAAKIGCTTNAGVEKINDYLKTPGLNQKCRFAWGRNFDNSDACLYALKISNEKTALMEGTDIDSVFFKQDMTSKINEINVSFKKAAIALWAEATKRNMNKAIAIVLDNNVISAPTVRSEIKGGRCMITGNYTQTQARYIAALGNNGVLPASFKIIK